MIGSSECSNIARHSTYHAVQGWGFIDGYHVGGSANSAVWAVINAF
jgi:hypothetical protein